ncbi:MAG TPA: corrinoid protein [Phycisphaerae bacterium]|nr:corrinoid protein [Phycisphaerae bacterium]HQL53337.1 corrinoid protein [Phycisphaerae bacterium]
MSLLEQIAQAVINGDEVLTPKLVTDAIAAGTPAADVLNVGLLKGMTEVGRLFREGEYFVPEVLIAAEAMKAGTALLKPHLAKAGVRPERTAIIGTVRGDLHDIGKNLVATMLEGAGFEVVDLGVDVPPEKFIAACRERKAHVVALSALLTTTMPMMETSIKQMKAELKPMPVVLVGGAPLTQEYADKIGADGYGRDAATGAELAKKLCASKR